VKEDRYTVKKTNNYSLPREPRDTWLRRAARYLRGMAYGVGSGAVSLIVMWVEARY
jgi:hypothetical protein